MYNKDPLKPYPDQFKTQKEESQKREGEILEEVESRTGVKLNGKFEMEYDAKIAGWKLSYMGFYIREGLSYPLNFSVNIYLKELLPGSSTNLLSDKIVEAINTIVEENRKNEQTGL